MTKSTQIRRRLRELLRTGATLAVPGVFDPLTALQVEHAGFQAAYLGSYAISSSLGLPDVGLLDLTELCSRFASVSDVLRIPLIADAEAGFYDAASIGRAVRALERSGVAAIHIEDHVSGKHTELTKRILEPAQMVQKIHAALDARDDPELMVIARTDALWASGRVADAVERMSAYHEAGADAVMAAGFSADQLSEVRAKVPGLVVLVNNGSQSLSQEQASRANVVIYHALCLQAAHAAVASMLHKFSATLNIQSIAESLSPAATVESLVDYAGLIGRGRKYGLE